MAFIDQFLRHPREIGALCSSSRYLARKMADAVDFDRAVNIVELGPGNGAITEELLRRKLPNASVYAIEIDEKFVDALKRRFDGSPMLSVIHDSAENLQDIVQREHLRVSAVVSTLPLTTLPKDMVDRILPQIRDVLAPEGVYVQVQHLLWTKYKLLQRYFPYVESSFELRNFLPAWVYACRKQKS